MFIYLDGDGICYITLHHYFIALCIKPCFHLYVFYCMSICVCMHVISSFYSVSIPVCTTIFNEITAVLLYVSILIKPSRHGQCTHIYMTGNTSYGACMF